MRKNLRHEQAWWPQYQQLGDESPEKVTAGVWVFGVVHNVCLFVGLSRALFTSRVLGNFGGFAELRQARWRTALRPMPFR